MKSNYLFELKRKAEKMNDFRTKAKEIEEEHLKMLEKHQIKDTIVESVINQFKQRSEIGIAKYGVTLDRTDLSTLDWINHAQQEAMDFCLYLEKIKQEILK